jgi:hypothetical protein
MAMGRREFTGEDYAMLSRLDGLQASRGLTQTQINQFPTNEATSTLPEPCVICLEEITPGQTVRSLASPLFFISPHPLLQFFFENKY